MFCPFMKQSKTEESGLSDKDDWAFFFYLSEYTLVVWWFEAMILQQKGRELDEILCALLMLMFCLDADFCLFKK